MTFCLYKLIKLNLIDFNVEVSQLTLIIIHPFFEGLPLIVLQEIDLLIYENYVCDSCASIFLNEYGKKLNISTLKGSITYITCMLILMVQNLFISYNLEELQIFFDSLNLIQQLRVQKIIKIYDLFLISDNNLSIKMGEESLLKYKSFKLYINA